PDCNATCQSSSGLILDAYLQDQDNDGITDTLDDDDNNDGIVDADIDGDGLIDITSLHRLDAMRYQLDGIGLRLTTDAGLDFSGCSIVIHQGIAQRRCHGYELVTDLDFDTNHNGVVDTNDDYWNDGAGWLPIGDSARYFTADFNGNGHVIRHLTINRPST
ncbi:hypothetical protein, partial [Oceaniserpentilla sp. 4NH20-0058]|uniref:hypothetical protein n=1 Tax=Oceaniserpentilla sp. 4NH20-0058 TaxID=3127660 RepID=UPI003342495E